MTGKIISIGTALPEYTFSQEEILEFMQQAYTDVQGIRKLKVLFHQSGIQKRYSVLPDFGSNARPTFFKHGEEQPDVSKRTEVYKESGLKLAIASIQNALATAQITLTEITHLITVTCTGIYAPGLGAQLIKSLNLPEDLDHTPVNFMGCNAAFYGLKIAELIVANNSKAKVAVVCVELCTLHFQPISTTDNLLSNTLFGDGAATALVASNKTEQKGLSIQGFHSLMLHKGWNHMGWNIQAKAFEMILSPEVPKFIEEEVEKIVEKASARYGISASEVTHWCVHPGGMKILNEVKRRLNLSDEEIQHSYEVLSEHGNMSSPTILFVLKRIMEKLTLQKNQIFALGFGPGLSIESALLKYE